MAPHTLWLFVLIPIVIHPHGAAQTKGNNTAAKYVPKTSRPWPFMITSPMYLNITTLDQHNAICIKAITIEHNFKARILSQGVVITRSDWSRDYARVDYQLIPKRGPLQALISVDRSGSTKYTLHHIFQHCAIIKKQMNKTNGGSMEVCDLWVNEKFFHVRREDQELCTRNFMAYCNHNYTKYKRVDCERTTYKEILLW
uniref:Putative group iv salivary lipocalin n=1 Tax=Rhipicephalus pulchellus TaxID=72859 RepID=L7MBY0_RHIPC